MDAYSDFLPKNKQYGKEEKNNFIEEKPDKLYLGQVTKATLTVISLLIACTFDMLCKNRVTELQTALDTLHLPTCLAKMPREGNSLLQCHTAYPWQSQDLNSLS